jgi:hypothetical protein
MGQFIDAQYATGVTHEDMLATLERALLIERALPGHTNDTTNEHTVTVRALPHADENNHPARVACEGTHICEQLATVNWHFAHDATGTASDTALCPQHAAEWMSDYCEGYDTGILERVSA